MTTPVPFALPGDPAGTTTAVLYPADADRRTSALLVLAHGAGAGQQSPFMTGYAQAFAERGVTVATFDFPYMATGRKLPDRAPVLEDAFRRAVLGAVAHPLARATAVFIGGKSMGGRMATHLAATIDQWPASLPLSGAVAFGYPLTPPGNRRTGDRVSHLRAITIPTLIVQGTRDTFGGPGALRDAIGIAPSITVLPVETGDHSFAVLKSSGRNQADVHREIQDAVVAWMTTLIGDGSREPGAGNRTESGR